MRVSESARLTVGQMDKRLATPSVDKMAVMMVCEMAASTGPMMAVLKDIPTA